MSRYGIAEWFGLPLHSLTPRKRKSLARAALQHDPAPVCPFQSGEPLCTKKGGVCSIRSGDGPPVILCPARFEEGQLLPRWLGEIVGFSEVYLAREVGFMRDPDTGRRAGRIDLVVAQDSDASAWFPLEVQAVYFSGDAMAVEFENLQTSNAVKVPAPVGKRRPDWRSSSAKRLMPQLQTKAPLLRQWGVKIALAIDKPFFEALGGASECPSQDLNDGDVIWLVPHIGEGYHLERHHWEVLPLSDSSDKLLHADIIRRPEFEQDLRKKLMPIGGTP